MVQASSSSNLRSWASRSGTNPSRNSSGEKWQGKHSSFASVLVYKLLVHGLTTRQGASWSTLIFLDTQEYSNDKAKGRKWWWHSGWSRHGWRTWQ